MKRLKFSDSQIVDAVKRVEAGLGIQDICREMGVSTAMFYKWRAKYGGMDVSMMSRMKELEEETRRFKKIYLEQKLKAEIVAEALEKKVMRPSRRREMAKNAVTDRGACIRIACKAFRIIECCYRYERKFDVENDEVANCLIRLTDNHRNWGGLCYLYLRNVKGFKWNHNRVYRIYKELELNLRVKPRKRLEREKSEALTVPQGINQVWSMDFIHDQMEDGRTFRLLNVTDDFSREAIGMEIDFSVPSERVIRELKQIISWRGKPEVIGCENGPEYISAAFQTWA